MIGFQKPPKFKQLRLPFKFRVLFRPKRDWHELDRRMREVRAYSKRLKIGPTYPYDRGGVNDTGKAVAYAQWLAQRDGISLSKYDSRNTAVSFSLVPMSDGTKVCRAESVRFGGILIPIPHTNYDPYLVPIDLGTVKRVSFKDLLGV